MLPAGEDEQASQSAGLFSLELALYEMAHIPRRAADAVDFLALRKQARTKDL